jgi:amidophosphoribosyltransferase
VDDSIVRERPAGRSSAWCAARARASAHAHQLSADDLAVFLRRGTPRRSELIAATHTLEEIRKYLDADSVAYLSLDGLTDSVPDGKTRYCTSCYTGVYPVAFPRDEKAYLQLALKLNPNRRHRRRRSPWRRAASTARS